MSCKRDVIVIAGAIEGIDALARLINVLPSAIPAVIVAVLHGARSSDDSLLETRPKTPGASLIVTHANHGERPEVGHLYIAPAGHDLIFGASGAMHLIPRVPSGSEPLEADRLFKAAAMLYGPRVIGVVLSGGGTSGTQGLQEITAAGGIRIVQSPVEARFSAMPISALLGDHVQFSVMLDQMGRLLAALTTDEVGSHLHGTAD